MKLATCIIICIIFSSCKNGMINFNLNFTHEAIIQNTLPVNVPVNLFTPETTTNTEKELEVRDSQKNLVEEVILETLTIEITSPQNQNFNFLQKIEIYINSPKNNEIKVAEKFEIPESQKKINLNAFDVNLKEYLVDDNFTLRIKTVTNQIPGQDVELEIYTDFNISAKVI